MAGIQRVVRGLLPLTPRRRRRLEREIADELADFRRRLIQDRRRAGLSRLEAEAEADRCLGEPGRIVDDCVRVHDEDPVRLGIRAAHTTLLLALGFAIAATLFAFLDGVFHRKPVAFRDDAQRVAVWWSGVGAERWTSESTLGEFQGLRGMTDVFDHATLAAYATVTLGDERSAELAMAKYVSADYFRLYGVEPLLGRGFAPDEVERQAAPVTVLSHDLWHERFSGTPDVLGRQVDVNRTPHTIVGVLPPDVPMYNDTALFVPLATRRAGPDAAAWLMAGRLRPGIGLAEANRRIARRVATMPRTPDRAGATPVLRRLEDVYAEPLRHRLELWSALGILGLLGVVAQVLQRVVAQSHWTSQRNRVRRLGGAIGPALAVAAAGVGLLFAPVATRALAQPLIGDLGRLFDLRIDTRLLWLATGVAIPLALLLSWLGNERERGRTFAPFRAYRRPIRYALLSFQLAVGVLLVLCAWPTIDKLNELSGRSPGFRSAGLLTIDVHAAGETPDQRRARLARTLRRLEGLPGVVGASFAQSFPTQQRYWQPYYRRAELPDAPAVPINFNAVDANFLDLLEVPLIEGRSLERGDIEGTPDVVVVNRTLAAALWPEGDAVGRRLILTPGDRSFEVVGVVGDVHHDGLARPAPAMLYRPYAQYAGADVVSLVVRTDGDPDALAATTVAALLADDPSLPFGPPVSADDRLRAGRGEARFVALASIALAALLLIPALVALIGLTLDATGGPAAPVSPLVVALAGVVAGSLLAATLSFARTPLRWLLADLEPASAVTLAAVVLVVAVLVVRAARAYARTIPLDILDEPPYLRAPRGRA